MAAILCSAPCKLLGECCDGLGHACKCICEPMKTALSSPFCLYVTAASILNIPPLFAALSVLPSVSSGGLSCTGVLWSIVMIPLCICNVVAAWYLSAKVSNHIGDGNESQGLRSKRTTAGRAVHILLYDPFVAIYILIAIGFLAWLILGGMWTGSGSMHDDVNCPYNIAEKTGTAMGFGWTFVFLGSAAFFCSLCCAGCDKTDRGEMHVWISPEQRQEQQQHSNTERTSPGYLAAGGNASKTTRNDMETGGSEGSIPIALPVPSTPMYTVNTGTAGVAQATVNESRAQSAPVTGGADPYANASAPEAMTPAEEEAEAKAAAAGSAMGARVGKVLGLNEKALGSLEHRGAQAGVAVNSSISAAKKFIGSKASASNVEKQ